MTYWLFYEIACLTLIISTLFSTLRRALYWIVGVAACVVAFVIGGGLH